MTQQQLLSDDVWLSEADGNGELTSSQRLIAEREYLRLQQQFQTLGMKEGASEGMDEFRQQHFEEGLKNGLKEGMMIGLLMELFSKQQQQQQQQQQLEVPEENQEKHSEWFLNEKIELWPQEQMDQVLKRAYSFQQEQQEENQKGALSMDHDREEPSLKWVSEVIQQFGEEMNDWLELMKNEQQ
nr:unnamed protein product [Naegleria fowleri]